MADEENQSEPWEDEEEQEQQDGAQRELGQEVLEMADDVKAYLAQLAAAMRVDLAQLRAGNEIPGAVASPPIMAAPRPTPDTSLRRGPAELLPRYVLICEGIALLQQKLRSLVLPEGQDIIPPFELDPSLAAAPGFRAYWPAMGGCSSSLLRRAQQRPMKAQAAATAAAPDSGSDRAPPKGRPHPQPGESVMERRMEDVGVSETGTKVVDFSNRGIHEREEDLALIRQRKEQAFPPSSRPGIASLSWLPVNKMWEGAFPKDFEDHEIRMRRDEESLAMELEDILETLRNIPHRPLSILSSNWIPRHLERCGLRENLSAWNRWELTGTGAQISSCRQVAFGSDPAEAAVERNSTRHSHALCRALVEDQGATHGGSRLTSVR